MYLNEHNKLYLKCIAFGRVGPLDLHNSPQVGRRVNDKLV